VYKDRVGLDIGDGNRDGVYEVCMRAGIWFWRVTCISLSASIYARPFPPWACDCFSAIEFCSVDAKYEIRSRACDAHGGTCPDPGMRWCHTCIHTYIQTDRQTDRRT